jgi:phospholipase C
LYDRLNGAPSRSWRAYYHDKNDILELYPSLKSDARNHSLFDSNFAADVANGKLPTYSFITPAFMGTATEPVNSMHAPADVRPAEKLVADIYNALRDNVDVWKKTLMIVVFDEHGGYFDHIPPPATVSPDNIPGRTDQSFLVPFNFERLGLRVPAILISPWFKASVDSTVYSHSTIPGSIIEALALPHGFLTERDKNAKKLTDRYLVDDGTHTWRTKTPDVTVPVQPNGLDAVQREMLDGSVHLDPHPELQNALRTRDIQDPAQAKHFIRTQVAKRLEHNLASGGNVKEAAELSADNQLATPFVSPARIAELRQSPHVPRHRPEEGPSGARG